MGYKICNSLVCQKREKYPNFYPHFAATEDDLIDHWISGVFTCTWLYDGLDDQNSSELTQAVLEDLSQKSFSSLI